MEGGRRTGVEGEVPTTPRIQGPPGAGARRPTEHGEPERWIVLGTGTGVGKSYVAEALVRLFASEGVPVAGVKPVETGCRTGPEGGPMDGDAARLEAASFHVKHPRPHPLYGFADPVAPSLAARREGQDIQPDVVACWVDRVRSTGAVPPVVVVETAGGVFSPLGDATTNFDLAMSLGSAHWILVAPDRIGVLHDLRSALWAMHHLGRSPDWIVLSEPEEVDASTGSNAPELARMGINTPIVCLRRHQLLARTHLRPSALPAAAERD